MHARALRCVLTATVAFLVPALAPAQQVWNVTNQTELLAAIAAAAPGDVIQLASSGTYDRFTLSKGLTLRGPANIDSQIGSLVLVTVPSGQIAQLVDLTFDVYTPLPPPQPTRGAVEIHGTARLDGCTISGANTVGAALRLVNANAVIERCAFNGFAFSAGIDASDSIVSVHGSTFHGSNGSVAPYVDAYPGIVATGSGSLHLSSSSFTGGDGFFFNHGPSPLAAPGIQTSVPTWVTDATVQGGNYTGPGFAASGLVVKGTAKASVARCTIAGGVANGSPAPAIAGNASEAPTLLGVSATPLARGALASIDVSADQPGVPITILLSVGLQPPQLLAFVTQPLWLGSAPVVIASGLSGSNAHFGLGFEMPADPALANVSLSFLGIRLGGAGVQITPTAGGVIR